MIDIKLLFFRAQIFQGLIPEPTARSRSQKPPTKLDEKCKDIEKEQHLQVTYLDRVLENVSFLKVLNKIFWKTAIFQKLKFLYTKNSCLAPELRKMLCNALIHPNFEHACSAWYSNIKLKKNPQITKHNCIRFCVKLDKMHHISEEDFQRFF